MPIEIIGVWKNGSGPRQDVILAKMGGKAKITNVAAGMSGSPVYIDGKLVGAVALRMSVFSPDAICGITPIELMLEIQEFDNRGRWTRARRISPSQTGRSAAGDIRRSSRRMINRVISNDDADRNAAGAFRILRADHQRVLAVVLSDGNHRGARRRRRRTSDREAGAGWRDSLNPGEAVSGVLVSGDMSATGMGTVTYNDGKKVLAFGHPFFNLGPLDMPMAKSEILMVLSSAFQPTKFGNATEVVGALRQDRFSGIMGELGAEAPFIPVHLKVRSLEQLGRALSRKRISISTSSCIRSGRRS